MGLPYKKMKGKLSMTPKLNKYVCSRNRHAQQLTIEKQGDGVLLFASCSMVTSKVHALTQVI